MRDANRIDSNAQWLSAQLHTIEDGKVAFVWNDKKARINQIDEAVKDMDIKKQIGTLYTMYYQRRK